MASVVGCLLVIGFFQGSVLGEQQQNTLNVPQVLLPYAPRGSVHTNFTLKALQGCYLWLSNRPEVATVQPVYNNEEDTTAARQFGRKCSREALVTAQARLPERQMTEILAEEEGFGRLIVGCDVQDGFLCESLSFENYMYVTSMILRSDVFVDTISKIEILTTTRELLLGEPPEVCHIQAFDTEGNVFSSLDGVEFVWELKTVEGVGSVNAESVLRFMQFEFSSYETCPEIYSLEEKGSRGSSIVVEPINTGTAIVKAKLKDKAFANVPPAQVKLIVLDNVMLVPGHDMYILVNTSITYSVIRLRQGRAAVVPMPSSQFEFKLSNTSVAQLDVKKSSVLGVKLGYTKVTLEDKNMLHIHSVHQPAAGVYVVEPAFLGFSITPHSDWFLEVGVEYDVSVQLYTHENRKIYITDNIQIVASFDDAYFKELWSSKNGSFYHVKTLQKGKTVLTALLTSIKILGTDTIHTFEHPISGQQEAEIFDPVVVNPEIVLFPWYPAPQQNVAAPNQYQFLLQPSGGSGMYMWSSSNTSVATVSTKGVVMTTSAVGYSLVRAADMKNPANFDTTEVYVLQPKKMEFIPAVVEALVGSSISLPLAVASCIYSECQEFHVFTDCRSLPVTYTFSDPSIFKLVEDNSHYEITAGSCMSVKLLALRSGFTTLTVTYQYNDIILKAAITVGAYHALKVLDPVEVGVVSLCSAKNLMLDGGPLPWITDTSSYYEDVFPEADKAEQVFIGNDHTEDFPADGSGSYHYFSIFCRKLGEQVLTVKIGNRPTPKNPYPASSSVKIRFACMEPASLTIVPDIKLPTVEGRQLSPENCVNSNKEIHVRNNQHLNLIAHLRDSLGRSFDNFTSLTVVWTTSDRSLAEFVDKTSSVKMMFVTYKKDEDLRKAISYQTVSLSDRMGGVVIQASVGGYECDTLRWCGQELKEPANFALTGRLKLLLVPERKLVPPAASILNHPENQAVFRIDGGSGRFAVKGSSNTIAKVDYQGKSELLVIPRSEGLFTVTVHDLCLDSTVPATLHVQVSDLYGVDVNVVNKIEIFSSEKLRLQLLDVLGSPLLLGSLRFLSLTPHFSPDILSIRRVFELEEDKVINRDTAYFAVRGLSLGTASLTFTASATGKGSATSRPRDIQVFAPLRLDPRVVVLIRGASFQVRSTGGPSPQTATLFNVVNGTVASVSSVGLVKALHLGTTNLTGLVQAADAAKGQTLFYSKDVIIVHVVQLKGVKINVASTNLVTETKVSIFASGLSDETPFTFANAMPGLKFRWSSSNPDVCQVKSVYALSGVAVESEKDFRVDLHCTNPGQTTITLTLEITDQRYQQAHSQALFRDDVTFDVYQRLQLIFPITGFMLLPHNVNTRLKTNRDGSARITYELITDCSQRTVASNSPAVVSVNRGGQLSTSSVSGTGVVLVTIHEEFGINQTAVVHVEVKAVSSLSITCQSPPVRANSDEFQTFPLGMNALFAVTLHDNIGREFAVASIPLKYRLNRFDAVHVAPGPENGTFYARAMNFGEAILKVWDPSAADIADYIRIRVGHGLTPSKATLLLGTVQQFSTSVISEGVGGVWSSSNSRVININSTTGVAVATAAGTAIIYYRIPELYSAQTEVKVESLTYIRVIPDDSLIITTVQRHDGRGFVIPVSLGHDTLSVEETSKTSGLPDGILLYEGLGAQYSIPVHCILNSDYGNNFFGDINFYHPYDVFEVKPGLFNGKLMCYLIPRILTADVEHAVIMSEAKLSLTVKVFDEIHGRSISSEATSLPFLPPFQLGDTELELTADTRKTTITVVGTAEQLNNLEVRSQDSSLVDLSYLSRTGDRRVEYAIEVIGQNPKSFKKLWVEFKSKLTGQRALVYVSYSAPYGGAVPILLPGGGESGQQCPTATGTPTDRSFQGFLLTLLGHTSAWIIGFSLFIGLLILVLILCCTPRHRDVGPGGVTTSPVSSAYGGTPFRGSSYGQEPYRESPAGTYSAGRRPYVFSPGAGDISSGRSIPEENDDTRRERLATYRRTHTTSRAFLSEEDSQTPGGSLPLGRVSPSKSPGLFSVTQ